MPMDTTYDTAELIQLQRDRRFAVPSFIRNRYFTQRHYSNSEWVYFDEIAGDRRLAPFVAPTLQGRVMRDRGAKAGRFKPAYLKPKHSIDPARSLRRTAGEPLMGSLTPQQRMNAAVADNLALERNVIERRFEYMAWLALRDGFITIEGEDYPTSFVDFGRDPSHTVQLVGAATWDNPDAPIAAQITGWQRLNRANGGGGARDMLLGWRAYDRLVANNGVQELLRNDLRGSTAVVERGPLAGLDVEAVGRFPSSNLNMWIYNEQYEDDAGNLVDFMDPDDVVLVGDVDGVQCFGAIQDENAQWRPLEMFPKVWTPDDPSVPHTMTQSAPLMIPGRPNATMRITTAE